MGRHVDRDGGNMAKSSKERDRTEAESPDVAGPLDRRLFVFRSALGAASVVGATPAEAQYVVRRVTDRDPYDRAGRRVVVRRRITDRDPTDAPGRGRGRVVRRVRRVTDRDPFDRAGRPVFR
jgi:hypothetical protein